MYLKRNSRYNEGVFSTAELDRILKEVSAADVRQTCLRGPCGVPSSQLRFALGMMHATCVFL